MICNGKNPRTDNYETPKHVWSDIIHLVPKELIVWEPFYCTGLSGENLRSLGLKVIHSDVDFFTNDFGQLIISNPPFSNTDKVLERMFSLGKPWILLMPSYKLSTAYFKKYASKHKIQIIVPKKRIQFIKDGIQTKGCMFDCYYYCYGLGLNHDITFL